MTPVTHLVQLQQGTERVTAVTFTPPTRQSPLPAHTIVGHAPVERGAARWSAFERNRRFVEFFTHYMRGELPLAPEVLERGAALPGQYLYAIDRRAPAGGDVPFTDVIGWYETDRKGRPVAGSFQYNPDHQLVTPAGKPSSILGDEKVAQVIARYVEVAQ